MLRFAGGGGGSSRGQNARNFPFTRHALCFFTLYILCYFTPRSLDPGCLRGPRCIAATAFVWRMGWCALEVVWHGV
eukprot:357225-Chlamydomonas_euryale.AAC.7